MKGVADGIAAAGISKGGDGGGDALAQMGACLGVVAVGSSEAGCHPGRFHRLGGEQRGERQWISLGCGAERSGGSKAFTPAQKQQAAQEGQTNDPALMMRVLDRGGDIVGDGSQERGICSVMQGHVTEDAERSAPFNHRGMGIRDGPARDRVELVRGGEAMADPADGIEQPGIGPGPVVGDGVGRDTFAGEARVAERDAEAFVGVAHGCHQPPFGTAGISPSQGCRRIFLQFPGSPGVLHPAAGGLGPGTF